MSYRSLADFLEELGHAGELTRVDDEVDPSLQTGEIVARTAKPEGLALLFGAVKGHDLPLLCNLFGTESRICRGLGIASLDELSDRVARLLDTAASESWFERLKAGAQPAALAGIAPRKVRSAACQQIVRLGSDINLDELPMLQTNTETVGRVVTAAVVFSAEPDSHRSVFGRFDLQRLDSARLAVCWAAYDEHARLLSEYRTRHQKMPLAVVIGGDPAFLLAAAAPMPPGVDLCALTGMLRDKSLDVVSCRGVDLEVPAEAEMILEGFIDPLEQHVVAGPFCGPTGQLTQARPAPVMHVTAVTHRANPIFAVTAPGRPPNEAVAVARAMQQAFQPLARLAMPELIDCDLPAFAAARHWAAVSIHKTYPGQGRCAAHRAWNLPAMMYAKVLVVVDGDVDVHDYQHVLAAITANMRPDRDVLIEPGLADPYDPAAPTGALGHKMAIDATRKLAEE